MIRIVVVALLAFANVVAAQSTSGPSHEITQRWRTPDGRLFPGESPPTGSVFLGTAEALERDPGEKCVPSASVDRPRLSGCGRGDPSRDDTSINRRPATAKTKRVRHVGVSEATS
jgi:hypothetical protein